MDISDKKGTSDSKDEKHSAPRGSSSVVRSSACVVCGADHMPLCFSEKDPKESFLSIQEKLAVTHKKLAVAKAESIKVWKKDGKDHSFDLMMLDSKGFIEPVKEKSLVLIDRFPGAIHTVCTMLDTPPICAEHNVLAEHTLCLMLTQGANWIKAEMNNRAKGGGKASSSTSITETPAITIDEIIAADVNALTTEPLMVAFKKHLGRPANKASAGRRAIMEISTANIKAIESWAEGSAVYEKLMTYDLTLTHYADALRGSAVKLGNSYHHVLSLFSRHMLDAVSEEVGITGYPKGNTPASALKNVGHHDWLFFAIEPRLPGAVAPPFKSGSRFGNVCHAIDLDVVSAFSVCTLGDLDTKNAKVGIARLERYFKGCGAAISTSEAVAVRSIHDPDTGEPVDIEVREFATMSEQMFIKGDIKKGLALSVTCLVTMYGLDEDIILNAPTPEVYNTLINCLFVPQVMVPHAIVTTDFSVFLG